MAYQVLLFDKDTSGREHELSRETKATARGGRTVLLRTVRRALTANALWDRSVAGDAMRMAAHGSWDYAGNEVEFGTSRVLWRKV